MNYRSTRDTSNSPAYVTSAEAIKKGLAPDGGLYMPDMIPRISSLDIATLRPMSHCDDWCSADIAYMPMPVRAFPSPLHPQRAVRG